MKCVASGVNPAFWHMLYFFAMNERGGHSNERIQCQCVPGTGKAGDTDAQVLRALRHLSSGGGTVQHRGPDFYRQRRLSGLLRQRGQYRGVPVDRGGSGYRRHDRRRLLRLCQHLPGLQKSGERPQEHRQRCGAVHHQQPDRDPGLSDVSKRHPDGLRRPGQPGDLCAVPGVFLLDYPGHPVLYVRP